MTQDYRKIADKIADDWIENNLEDIEEKIGWEVKAKHVQHLYEAIEKALIVIAQEARREENEACAEISDRCGENTADTKYRFGIIIASQIISEAIRSRMIGPEPMEAE